MDLPVRPPIKPMLAKAVDAVPTQPAEPAWSYEPKWDGFRCLVFRDGDDVVLGSRSTKELTRYFPELVDVVRAELPRRCVLDGEVVVPKVVDGRTRLDWESLSQRIHPANSRVQLLAGETPAQLVLFDALAVGDENLMAEPFARRRAELLDAVGDGPSIHATAATDDAETAQRWFAEFEGAGLDGVVAKRLSGRYLPDKRDMLKIKHHRSADVVVLGYRLHKSKRGIGSMLLGLYRNGELHMIGGASAFSDLLREQYLAELEPLRVGTENLSGEPNRWNQREDHSWVPLRPERVVEIAYDQMEGDRLRHVARFVRWRPDRDPESCTYDQLEVPVRYDFADVLAGGAS
ncbi:MAG: ATP-dependent DNA ligase [Mycobacteriaceae bacterium]